MKKRTVNAMFMQVEEGGKSMPRGGGGGGVRVRGWGEEKAVYS